MQFSFAKCQSVSLIAKKAAIAALATGGILALLTSSASAESRDFGPLKNKSSLYAVYQQWSANRGKPINIQPAAVQYGKNAEKAATTTKNSASDDITDADILAQSDAEVNDPFEPINRLIFGFNEILDFVIFTPVSYTYRTIVPDPVRTGVSNAVANAKAPVTFANDLLQGEPERAKTTFMRFLINSTVGFGGFVDAAEAGGFEKHTEDFGQTLGVWGFGPGPYIVAPVLGPSSPRHLVGRVVDTAATPTTWILADFSLLERSSPTIADLVTTHEALLDDAKTLRESSPDFYASVRDIYRQSRKNATLNGDLGVDPIPDLPVE